MPDVFDQIAGAQAPPQGDVFDAIHSTAQASAPPQGDIFDHVHQQVQSAFAPKIDPRLVSQIPAGLTAEQFSQLTPEQSRQFSQQVQPTNTSSVPQSAYENWAHGAQRSLAGLGTGILGTVAPQTANQLQQNVNEATPYDPASVSGFAGDVTGNALPMVAGMGEAGVISKTLPYAFGAAQAGQAREDVAQRRAGGQQIGGGAEAVDTAVQGIIGTLASKVGLSNITGDLVKPLLARAGVQATDTMIQQALSNFTAQATGVAPERSVGEGVLRAGAIGAVTGAGLGAVHQAFGGEAAPAAPEQPHALQTSAGEQAATEEGTYRKPTPEQHQQIREAGTVLENTLRGPGGTEAFDRQTNLLQQLRDENAAKQAMENAKTPQDMAQARAQQMLTEPPKFTEGAAEPTQPGEIGYRSHQTAEVPNETVAKRSNLPVEAEKVSSAESKPPFPVLPSVSESQMARENVQPPHEGSTQSVSESPTGETPENVLSGARRRRGMVAVPTAEDTQQGIRTVAQKTADALTSRPVRELGEILGSDLGLDSTGRKTANDIRGMFGRQELARARLEEQFKPSVDLAEKIPQDEQAGILSHMEQNAGHSPDPRFADYAEQRHALNTANHERMAALQKRDMLGVNNNVYDLNQDWVGRSFEFPDDNGRFPGDKGYDQAGAKRSLAGKEDALRRRKFDTLEDAMSAVKELGGRTKYNNLFKMALDKDITVSNSLTAREALADMRDKGQVRVADLDSPVKPGEKEITDRTGRMSDRRFSASYAVAKDLHDSTIPLQQRISTFRERLASGDILPLNPSGPRTLKEPAGEENLEATGSGNFNKTLPKGHVMVDEAVSRAADPRKLVARRDIANMLNNVSDRGTDTSLVNSLMKANQAATKLKLAVNVRHYLTETMGSSGEFYGQALKDLLRGAPIRALKEAVEGTPGINTAAAIFKNAKIRDAILHGETGEAMASGGAMSAMTKSSKMFKQPEFEAMKDAMHKGDLEGALGNFLDGTLGKLNQSLFDHFIPMMRRHVMAMKAESELAARGSEALKPGQSGPSLVGSEEFNDLMAKHAKTISNLMGVEDDRIHFQNKVASTVSHALFGVPNWTLGKLRATADVPAGLLQVFKGRNMSPAVYSMIGGLVTMAGVGEAAYMMMHHGQATTDWNKIRRPGGWEIPSPWELISDVFTGHTGVADAIHNRLSPLIQFATDMTEGHNGIGKRTRDTWAQIRQSLIDDFIPISASNASKAKTPGEVAAGVIGLSHSKESSKSQRPHPGGFFPKKEHHLLYPESRE